MSVSTVSYVLSGKRSISAKTTDKVMAAVERLGYTPDASARKMRGMRNHIFALSAPIRVISIRPNTTLTSADRMAGKEPWLRCAVAYRRGRGGRHSARDAKQLG